MHHHPSLVDRSIIVTGGSRGLGRAMTLALIEAGARVAIVAGTASPQLDRTLAIAAGRGGAGRCVPIVADVRQSADCERAAREATAAFGAIDVLVNNAGVPNAGAGAPFWQVGVEAWDRMVRTNVDGPFLMARSVVPAMIERGRGKLIDISTSDATMVRRNFAPYGPSKAFLEAASRIWAQDLAGTGVTVNVLLPGGAVDTTADVTGAATPGRTFLPASVMCAPALWLCSAQSDGHTGERFVANLWNEALPLAQRIAAARQSGVDVPRIM